MGGSTHSRCQCRPHSEQGMMGLLLAMPSWHLKQMTGLPSAFLSLKKSMGSSTPFFGLKDDAGELTGRVVGRGVAIDLLWLRDGDLLILAVRPGLDALEAFADVDGQPESPGVLPVDSIQESAEGAVVAGELSREEPVLTLVAEVIIRLLLLVHGRVDAHEMERVVTAIAANELTTTTAGITRIVIIVLVGPVSMTSVEPRGRVSA